MQENTIKKTGNRGQKKQEENADDSQNLMILFGNQLWEEKLFEYKHWVNGGRYETDLFTDHKNLLALFEKFARKIKTVLIAYEFDFRMRLYIARV